MSKIVVYRLCIGLRMVDGDGSRMWPADLPTIQEALRRGSSSFFAEHASHSDGSKWENALSAMARRRASLHLPLKLSDYEQHISGGYGIDDTAHPGAVGPHSLPHTATTPLLHEDTAAIHHAEGGSSEHRCIDGGTRNFVKYNLDTEEWVIDPHASQEATPYHAKGRTGHRKEWEAELPTWLSVLFDVVFVLLARILMIAQPLAEGSGIPEMKCELGGASHLLGFFRPSVLLAKSIGLILVISAGLPVGAEGPMVHIAACIGSSLLRQPFFATVRQIPNTRRQVLSAAVATGVAAIFRAPIGGVLFALEVTSNHFFINTYWICLVASVVGSFVFVCVKTSPLLGLRPFMFSDLTFSNHESPLRAIGFASYGVILGLLGGYFIKAFAHTGRLLAHLQTIWTSHFGRKHHHIAPGRGLRQAQRGPSDRQWIEDAGASAMAAASTTADRRGSLATPNGDPSFVRPDAVSVYRRRESIVAVHGHDDEAAAATAVSGRYTTSASSSRRENIRLGTGGTLLPLCVATVAGVLVSGQISPSIFDVILLRKNLPGRPALTKMRRYTSRLIVVIMMMMILLNRGMLPVCAVMTPSKDIPKIQDEAWRHPGSIDPDTLDCHLPKIPVLLSTDSGRAILVAAAPVEELLEHCGEMSPSDEADALCDMLPWLDVSPMTCPPDASVLQIYGRMEYNSEQICFVTFRGELLGAVTAEDLLYRDPVVPIPTTPPSHDSGSWRTISRLHDHHLPTNFDDNPEPL
ncbi:chloride channel, putative [Perkinsus marinus ATCC 50983]|uniref:Chloride channel, putative n=1 Tax=Perkinsus marinus (strain ATCC 50983 / TXsc) TaxID=423536 RepID=C5LDY2_PERM5|nr:chloride channel, putative [Perkinsus marinus ATCC 50983]EER05146.1 chloride channel, putative [Perkinsus marinus ATCC 50983]|eukprot:XP_002773330.1 chloride channel, putative [Perkinsus marinus ATCC 50983]